MAVLFDIYFVNAVVA